MTPPRSLLDDIPLGGLLARLLRLSLGADTRDAFVGDLIEEAQLRRRFCTRAMIIRWVWSQALRSLPALLGMRLRAAGAAVLARLGGTPARPLGLVAGPRGGHRGWPLSLAVSLSAHALVVVAAVGLVLSRIDEVEPPAAEADLATLLPAEIEVTNLIHEAEGEPAPAPALLPAAARADAPIRPVGEPPAPRRYRPARKPLLTGIAPLPVAGPLPGNELPGPSTPSSPSAMLTSVREGTPGATGGRPEFGPGIWLPPRVAEKRCLSCPQPQLAPHYARLARGHDMLVNTCVSAQGEVQSATVVRGFDSIIDREVTGAVHGWRLRPYFLDGHPVPFCYVTRFVFLER